MAKPGFWILLTLLLGAVCIDAATAARPVSAVFHPMFTGPVTEFARERAFWTGDPGMTMIRGHLESPGFTERVRG